MVGSVESVRVFYAGSIFFSTIQILMGSKKIKKKEMNNIEEEPFLVVNLMEDKELEKVWNKPVKKFECLMKELEHFRFCLNLHQGAAECSQGGIQEFNGKSCKRIMENIVVCSSEVRPKVSEKVKECMRRNDFNSDLCQAEFQGYTLFLSSQHCLQIAMKWFNGEYRLC